MRDGFIGIAGTGGTYLLQDVSLWLSITCALATLTHFGMLFHAKYKDSKKNDAEKK